MAEKKYTVIQGDSAEQLKHIADNSIDAVVTDPPYGIEFLGKAWASNTGAVAIWQQCHRILKPGGYLLAFSAARTYHHLATNIETVGFEIRDQLMWIYSSGFPKAQDMGKAIQRRMGVKEIEGYADTTKNAGFGQTDHARVRAGVEWSTTETQVAKVRCTDPEAVKWQGWKTAMKPGHEPIVMARKRFRGSTIDNIQRHGVGALNIDASRIPYEHHNTPQAGNRTASFSFGHIETQPGGDGSPEFEANTQGRFPSNVMGDIPDYQKYFYCPKVSRRERHVGFEDPGAMFQGDRFDVYMPTAGKTNPDKQITSVEKKVKGKGNNHPTVKPVALMRYLIQLVTPANSHVIDPFTGSGTTGMAAVELGHRFTGIEQDPAYVEIANKRIAGWLSKDTDKDKEKHSTQYDRLFE
jgi:site-specific DNA-methyltransferase (adenine-specific)